MKNLINILKNIRGTIYIAGNGHSCDIADGFHQDLGLILKTVPLTKSSMITKIGNDFGFEHIFSKQVEHILTKDDCVVCFSSSGTSPNIVNLIKLANEVGAKSVLFTGSMNELGKNLERCDFYIVSSATTYEDIEDSHFLHIHNIKREMENEV